MRVALITRATFRTVRGGDSVQIEATARELNRLGIDAQILHAGEKILTEKYDLLHFFNLTRPADILKHVLHARRPFVVTPIWIDYSQYDKYQREGISGKAMRWLSSGRIEYAKTIARWIKNNDVAPGWTYLRMGQDKSIREILARTSLLLTNSKEEYEEIRKHYPHVPAFAHVTVGIDKQLFQQIPDVKREGDLVLCVGRIEGIKNQLNLIKAINRTQLRLVLIGDAAPNQPEYYETCKRMAGPRIRFISQLPQAELPAHYARASVHVLPSWYESCGLASLEAAAMGSNVVVTRNGFAASYFGEDAFYCDPGSVDSILHAINEATTRPANTSLQNRILSRHTWETAARQTLQAYEKVLARS